MRILSVAAIIISLASLSVSLWLAFNLAASQPEPFAPHAIAAPVAVIRPHPATAPAVTVPASSPAPVHTPEDDTASYSPLNALDEGERDLADKYISTLTDDGQSPEDKAWRVFCSGGGGITSHIHVMAWLADAFDEQTSTPGTLVRFSPISDLAHTFLSYTNSQSPLAELLADGKKHLAIIAVMRRRGGICILQSDGLKTWEPTPLAASQSAP